MRQMRNLLTSECRYETETETVVAPEPEVKEVAASSVVTSEPAPEEPLPQIAELKEEKAIVVAVVQFGALEQVVEMLKLETETLKKTVEELSRQRPT